MLNIQYLSDLHLETYHRLKIPSILKKITKTADILVLCGDIGNPFSPVYKTFLDYVSNLYEKIFIIAGNHEFYRNGFSIEETLNHIQKIVDDKPNISFLNDTYEIYKDHIFIGTILWSEIVNVKDAERFSINDLHSIKDMSIEKYNNLHLKSVEFLSETLEFLQTKFNSDKNIIILTHHLPLYEIIDKTYLKEYEKYNQWFASNLKELIIKYQSSIKIWFYGHTHMSSEIKMFDIIFTCNPIGYYSENNSNDYSKVVRI